mmetsp:Transcript_60733/g.121897  ORF Transcript_60733/g.121897 Transcript_60733/m.121897 type:complete len:374 (-) Transcript_60733:897-2018(-)
MRVVRTAMLLLLLLLPNVEDPVVDVAVAVAVEEAMSRSAKATRRRRTSAIFLSTDTTLLALMSGTEALNFNAANKSSSLLVAELEGARRRGDDTADSDSAVSTLVDDSYSRTVVKATERGVSRKPCRLTELASFSASSEVTALDCAGVDPGKRKSSRSSATRPGCPGKIPGTRCAATNTGLLLLPTSSVFPGHSPATTATRSRKKSSFNREATEWPLLLLRTRTRSRSTLSRNPPRSHSRTSRSMLALSAALGVKCVELRGRPVRGLSRWPRENQAAMALRSKVNPSAAVTGSDIFSAVMGHRYSSATRPTVSFSTASLTTASSLRMARSVGELPSGWCAAVVELLFEMARTMDKAAPKPRSSGTHTLRTNAS